MKYRFFLSKDKCESETEGLDVICQGAKELFTRGLTTDDVSLVLNMSSEQDILAWANNLTHNNFVLFLYNTEAKSFVALNDKYGHNEIYIQKQGSNFLIASDLDKEIKPEINKDAAYEFLSFHSIVPPRTIFKGIEMVPAANGVLLNLVQNTHEYRRYWNIEALFNEKYTDYESLVKDLREVFYAEIGDMYTQPSAVALSGGIDSGGILAMLADAQKKDVLSVSFGPYGPNSGDLVSSKMTAEKCSSKNIELYPTSAMFDTLLDTVLPKLSQPLPGDQLLAISKIYETAQMNGVDKLYFGYGTQMVLGNLGLNKLWHRTRLLEAIFPRFIMSTVIKLFARFTGLSKNAEALLLESDWLTRFFYAQAALYTREKHIYKDIPDDFIEQTTNFLKPVLADENELKLSDRFVMLYLLSWTNYGQERNNAMLGRVFGITPFSPYNSPVVAEVILKTPDKFRKKNRWNKQLWRDALKPYVPEHLYMRRGKSLTVPYSKIFASGLEVFLPYLKSNSLISSLIDFEVYQETYHNLPEPGLNLLRLITLAAWYDSRYNPEKINALKVALKEFDFDKKAALHMNAA